MRFHDEAPTTDQRQHAGLGSNTGLIQHPGVPSPSDRDRLKITSRPAGRPTPPTGAEPAAAILADMNTEGALPTRVLVVDDERALAAVIASYLTRAGHQVTQAHTGPDAVAQAKAEDPDVIVLDLGLPGLDGIEVCRQIRTFSDCYILILTARGDEVDRLIGLSVGADDYLTKPFSNRELVARVQTVLRRPRRPPAATPVEEHRVFGNLRIDAAGHEVWIADQPVALTRTEFDLLDVLSAQPRVALSRRQLIDTVWDTAWVGDEHVVDVHVANLRKKLDDDPTEPRYITTIRGVGYRMGRG